MTNNRVDVEMVEHALSVQVSETPGAGFVTGDRRDGRVFRADEQLRLAIRVALATARPLLLRGLPGTGKSSVAAFIAERLGWRYHELVMTSETAASELLWRYDAVRRLADAQMAGARMRSGVGSDELSARRYVQPGPLWWGLSPETAASQGESPVSFGWTMTGQGGTRPGIGQDGAEVAGSGQTDPLPENAGRDPAAAVVLIDEIDKAEPNVPNALLVPLGSQSFVVEPTGQRISLNGEARQVLIIITTNEERELPRAFIRRCVVHTMRLPDAPEMVEIAAVHDDAAERPMSDSDRVLCRAIADRVAAIQKELSKSRQRPPGTAEFLDAWRTARALDLTIGHPDWAFVEQVTLRKKFDDLLEEGL